MSREFSSPQQIRDAVGHTLGTSDWLTVQQNRIDRFADATDDHQWLHVDSERAAAGPFGSTIAHGFLTLSLIPALASQIYQFPSATMRVNYGLNRVRFITPVRTGQRVRATTVLQLVDDVPGGVQLTLEHVIAIDGVDKPACTAEMLSRIIF